MYKNPNDLNKIKESQTMMENQSEIPTPDEEKEDDISHLWLDIGGEG